MTNMPTYKAAVIADYFRSLVDESIGDAITNMKLQKLVYYAAGLGLAVRDGERLVEEDFAAWQHGPVVPSLYHEFKTYGGKSIPPIDEFDFDKITAADRLLLDDVYRFYGQYSAWKLREMTHQETPWIEAADRDQGEDQISQDTMTAFFKREVNPAYVKSYKDRLGEAQ